jgi:hypothetical protein
MMRLSVPLLVVAMLWSVAPASAGTQDSIIKLFSADYYLTRDDKKVPELKVTENIVAEFPNFDQSHGILRAIPATYKDHSLELQVSSVRKGNGEKWSYSTYTENDNMVLKIGDADKYVRGEQTYVIEYTMRGVIMDTREGQEFFWDVNGDQWQQPFQKAEARLHIPADIAKGLQTPSRCYTGKFGSQQSNCDIHYSYDRGDDRVITVATKAGTPLQAGETLSLEFGFAGGTFAPYTPSAREMSRLAMMAAAVVLPPLLTLFVVIRNYLRTGRDPKGKGTIVPQYLPPKDVSVLASSAVLNEGFQSKAASATMIDLAVRHYLKVYEVGEKGIFKNVDYEVELIKSPDSLHPDEQGVVDMLFGSPASVGDRVALASLKTSLATKAQKLGEAVEKRTSDAGYFTKTPSKAKAPYYITAVVLMVAGFILFGLTTPLAIGLLVSAAILGIGAFAMPARTSQGVELREYLHGLRDYIKMAEADRLKLLQSPRGGLTEKIDTGDNKQLVKLYERLLPYAMLFGLEKEWAKTMAPLYDQQPDWYSGHTAFNAAWFAGSLSGFNTTAGTAFSPPSSSGSGGGAGGGGGGGGGGTW